MAKRIIGTTPKQDGYRMPAEFEPQQGVWMLWPERNDNWRDGGKPAQKVFADVAKAIARFEKVTVGASVRQYQNARQAPRKYPRRGARERRRMGARLRADVPCE